jgi:nucleoside-diphosphate-sugar epimerase
MNVLITGVTGFIGQRLANAIGLEIRVLSRVKQPNFETVKYNP